jgi:hypothetical protein
MIFTGHHRWIQKNGVENKNNHQTGKIKNAARKI